MSNFSKFGFALSLSAALVAVSSLQAQDRVRGASAKARGQLVPSDVPGFSNEGYRYDGNVGRAYSYAAPVAQPAAAAPARSFSYQPTAPANTMAAPAPATTPRAPAATATAPSARRYSYAPSNGNVYYGYRAQQWNQPRYLQGGSKAQGHFTN